MIDTLYLKEHNNTFKQYNYTDNDENKFQFKKINIFVGENNSGKSRFMRELFLSFREKEIKNNDKKYFYNSIDIPFISVDDANEEFDKFLSSYEGFFWGDKNMKIAIENTKNLKKLIAADIDNYNISFNKYTEIINNSFFLIEGVNDQVGDYAEMVAVFYEQKKDILKNFSYSSYIPILRSLKRINTGGAPLQRRTLEDYFKIINHDTNIFTGENLYVTIKELRGSFEHERIKVDNFQDFLSVFFNEKVIITPIKNLGKDDQGNKIENLIEDLYIKIGNEPERSISTLGDGIQALIILTFPLFLNSDKNHLLFIEEPELNLHPGFQRIFLEIISSDKFPNTQVFITTHSNHFLDLAIENSSNIEIFSFHKKIEMQNVKFEINNITNRAYEALELLGVNSSSLFLSNCTIWVEGISERLYLRHYLELLYQFMQSEDKEKISVFKEDIHYSFIEYSGNNLTHWSFYEDNDPNHPNINYTALSKKVFVIADKDDGKETKHETLKRRLGKAYYQLPCREIENLLSPKVIKDTLDDYKYKEENKNKNSNIIRDFSYNEYENLNFGNFISGLIKDSDIKQSILTSPNNNKNRTLANKSDFTKKAITHIKSWDDMSQNAKDLTEKIYEFIKMNN